MPLREQKTVTIGQGDEALPVVVKEVTAFEAGLINKAVLDVDPGKKFKTVAEVANVILGDMAVKAKLLAECTSLGEEVNDLGGTVFLDLWDAFVEVNQSFFAAMIRRMGRGRGEIVEDPGPPPKKSRKASAKA